MASALFDLTAEYDAMLQQGLRLSGESREFFLVRRLDSLMSRLPAGFAPRRILDFGCGLGSSCAQLAERFPRAQIVGVDTALKALEFARQRYGGAQVRFLTVDAAPAAGPFDLCYINGVLHHIAPAERATAIGLIYRALGPQGRLAVFENNPWNPGARMVMRRIPFDRDAIMLSMTETRRLLRQAGFTAPRTWSLFYFPRALRALRPLEPALAGLPLGAQYCVLAAKS